MTSLRRSTVAAGMAAGWTGVLLAGADWPPPPGFAVVVVLAGAAGAFTCARAPTYRAWAASRRPGRALRVLAEGAATGLAVGLALMLLRGTALPLQSAAAWLGSVCAAGMVHTGLSYALLVGWTRKR